LLAVLLLRLLWLLLWLLLLGIDRRFAFVAKVVIVVFFLFFDNADSFAFLTRLVNATVLCQIVGSRKSFAAMWANVWTFLSVRANVPFQML